MARGLRRDIERVTGNSLKSKDVIAAVALGTERLEYDDVAGALIYLRWARQEAGNAAPVRELVGIALYLDGQYDESRKELQAYRRMTQAQDQNHLIADCYRALGRDLRQIPELVEAMADAPVDRQIEGRIVWASHVADEGDAIAALSILQPALTMANTSEGAAQAARVWYVAGDLCVKAERPKEAARWFKRVVDDGDEWDAQDRLDTLAELED
jgi:tetratricopeptide (TPR) repeat protein